MKFAATIGNPPYQENKIGTSDKPIYHLFIDVSSNIANRSTLITPARFLFNAGNTPKQWNLKMLSNPHFRIEVYKSNSQEVFSNVDIKGGIAITTYDKNKINDIIGCFTPYQELKSIINKVASLSTHSLSNFVYAPESYRFTNTLHKLYPNISKDLGLSHLFDITTNIFDKIPYVFSDTKNSDDIAVLGRKNNKRKTLFINSKFVAPHENLNKWKIILPKSNGSGKFGETLTNPILGEPKMGHTQTFISIGAFDSKTEAYSLLKYLHTKFLRALLSSLKVTQDNKKSTWANVPMQDFTENSDIDWSKNVEEIDAQLYAKYHLSDDEIRFIESMIRPM